VAHAILSSWGVESGRLIRAPIAASMPPADADSIISRTRAMVFDPAAGDSSFGSICAATPAGPFPASSSRMATRPSRPCGVSAVARVSASTSLASRAGCAR